MSDIQSKSQAVLDNTENNFHGAFEAWKKRSQGDYFEDDSQN
jgi:hypothetical protein